MFAEHQPIISEYGRANPEHWAHVATFVMLTARVPLARVGADLIDVQDARNEQDVASILFGWKASAFGFVHAHKGKLHTDCEHILAASTQPADALLNYVVRSMPGFGLVKGGFLLQLLYGLSGCLDTHNLRRFNVPRSAVRADTIKRTTSQTLVDKKIRAYNRTITKLGGTEALWNEWCHYLAETQPKLYRSAEYVSALHVSALGL